MQSVLILPLSCYISQQPVLYCAVEMVSTPRDAASVIVAGREPSVMCPVPSVWILYAAAMEYALWAPVLVMEVIRGRTVRKVNKISDKGQMEEEQMCAHNNRSYISLQNGSWCPYTIDMLLICIII